jgi:DeoR/GlpR family transcriptional regulator of sugar metabolism
VDAGFTCGTEGDMAVKAMVMRKARTKVIMCDKGKFSRLMPYTFAHLSDVDYLISDDAVPEAIVHEAHINNVTIL